jgi:methionine-rich copper-binding protein CopC
MKRFLVLLCLLICGLEIASVAAHGYVERTDPADGAELPQSPRVIRAWFSEPLQADSASLTLINSEGQPFAFERIEMPPDGGQILVEGTLAQGLPAGAYILTVSATVLSDGHQPTASIVFWVGQKPTAIVATPSPAPRPAYALPIFFLMVGALSVGGVYLLNQWQGESLSLVDPSHTPPHYPLE